MVARWVLLVQFHPGGPSASHPAIMSMPHCQTSCTYAIVPPLAEPASSEVRGADGARGRVGSSQPARMNVLAATAAAARRTIGFMVDLLNGQSRPVHVSCAGRGQDRTCPRERSPSSGSNGCPL